MTTADATEIQLGLEELNFLPKNTTKIKHWKKNRWAREACGTVDAMELVEEAAITVEGCFDIGKLTAGCTYEVVFEAIWKLPPYVCGLRISVDLPGERTKWRAPQFGSGLGPTLPPEEYLPSNFWRELSGPSFKASAGSGQGKIKLYTTEPVTGLVIRLAKLRPVHCPEIITLCPWECTYIWNGKRDCGGWKLIQLYCKDEQTEAFELVEGAGFEIRGEIPMWKLIKDASYEVVFELMRRDGCGDEGWDSEVEVCRYLPYIDDTLSHKVKLDCIPTNRWVQLVAGNFKAESSTEMSSIRYSLKSTQTVTVMKGFVFRGICIRKATCESTCVPSKPCCKKRCCFDYETIKTSWKKETSSVETTNVWTTSVEEIQVTCKDLIISPPPKSAKSWKTIKLKVSRGNKREISALQLMKDCSVDIETYVENKKLKAGCVYEAVLEVTSKKKGCSYTASGRYIASSRLTEICSYTFEASSEEKTCCKWKDVRLTQGCVISRVKTRKVEKTKKICVNSMDLCYQWEDKSTGVWCPVTQTSEEGEEIQVMTLEKGCDFEVFANIEVCKLVEETVYEAVFQITRSETKKGEWESAVELCVDLPNGTRKTRHVSLAKMESMQSQEVIIGSFQVIEYKKKTIRVSMRNCDNTKLKEGLMIKCLLIRPSPCRPTCVVKKPCRVKRCHFISVTTVTTAVLTCREDGCITTCEEGGSDKDDCKSDKEEGGSDKDGCKSGSEEGGSDKDDCKSDKEEPEEVGSDKDDCKSDAEEGGSDKIDCKSDKEEGGSDKDDCKSDKEEGGSDKDDCKSEKEEGGSDKDDCKSDKEELEEGGSDKDECKSDAEEGGSDKDDCKSGKKTVRITKTKESKKKSEKKSTSTSKEESSETSTIYVEEGDSKIGRKSGAKSGGSIKGSKSGTTSGDSKKGRKSGAKSGGSEKIDGSEESSETSTISVEKGVSKKGRKSEAKKGEDGCIITTCEKGGGSEDDDKNSESEEGDKDGEDGCITICEDDGGSDSDDCKSDSGGGKNVRIKGTKESKKSSERRSTSNTKEESSETSSISVEEGVSKKEKKSGAKKGEDGCIITTCEKGGDSEDDGKNSESEEGDKNGDDGCITICEEDGGSEDDGKSCESQEGGNDSDDCKSDSGGGKTVRVKGTKESKKSSERRSTSNTKEESSETSSISVEKGVSKTGKKSGAKKGKDGCIITTSEKGGGSEDDDKNSESEEGDKNGEGGCITICEDDGGSEDDGKDCESGEDGKKTVRIKGTKESKKSSESRSTSNTKEESSETSTIFVDQKSGSKKVRNRGGKSTGSEKIDGPNRVGKDGSETADKSGQNILGRTASGRYILGCSGIETGDESEEKSGRNVIGRTKSGREILGCSGIKTGDKSGKQSRQNILGRTASGRYILGCSGVRTGDESEEQSGGNVIGRTLSGRDILGCSGTKTGYESGNKSGRNIVGRTSSGRDVLGCSGVRTGNKSGRNIIGRTPSGRDILGCNLETEDEEGTIAEYVPPENKCVNPPESSEEGTIAEYVPPENKCVYPLENKTEDTEEEEEEEECLEVY